MTMLIIVLMNFISYTLAKPNIVIIIGDDIGWNDVSHHGSNQIFTPNIDALGYNGIIFDKYYSYHACSPSRAAFLTGQYPLRFGYQSFPLRDGENRTLPNEINTLPRILKPLGYGTHLVGKWHLGFAYRNATPTGHGFDTHYGYWGGHIGYFDQRTTIRNRFVGYDFHFNLQTINETGNYVTDLITKRAIKIIEEQNEDTPLFMVVSHLAAHVGQRDELEVADINFTNNKYFYIAEAKRRRYAEIVETLDKSVGTILKTLEMKQILNNTIVIYFSDNGAATHGFYANYGSNWPWRGMKLSFFDGSIRVPAVLYTPLLKNKGRVYNKLFHITDWMPTLYEAAGGIVEEELKLDGISHWRNIVNDENVNVRTELLVEIDDILNRSAYIGYNGTDYNADFSGESDRTIYYDYKSVVLSDTNLAINHIEKLNFSQQFGKFQQLRDTVTHENCRPTVNASICNELCLFDLENDPCESVDISQNNLDIVADLKGKIKSYYKVLIPRVSDEVDPNSDPKLCAGIWFNWLEDDACSGSYYLIVNVELVLCIIITLHLIF